MRPAWDGAYANTLSERFAVITDGLEERVAEVTQARTAPAVEDMAIGSGRRTEAAVLFFDICGFTRRTSRDNFEALGETLYMLDCVIPMVMGVVFDHGGYVEKNTGDGVMAIVGVGEDAEVASDAAIDIAVVSLWILRNIVNPHLASQGIREVEASIGIDYGKLLLARIGTRRGTSKHDRSHVTAIGPTANIAFLLQDHAGTDEILVGDLVYDDTSKLSNRFEMVHIPDWAWTIADRKYYVWEYTGRRVDPYGR